MILSESHLCQLLCGCVTYYHVVRPHQRLTTTFPDSERYSRPRSGVWSPPRRLAGSMTSTSAPRDPGLSSGPRSLVRATHHPPVVACLGFAGGRAWQSPIAVTPDADRSCPHPASEDRKDRADQVSDQDRLKPGFGIRVVRPPE